MLCFEGVYLRYRPQLRPSLADVSVTVPGGSAVGVVGRTGAGKSTLLAAAFRLVQLEAGTISLDGVNLASLPLQKARQAMGVIPQNPILFSGSLRYNLDPMGVCDDQELWAVLERTHMKGAIGKVANGLDAVVSANGENWSVGERQLLCLARALLLRAPVLWMDEATAAVDVHTDQLIQATIRGEVGRRTLITIAHRLQTIMGYTYVLGMAQGRVVEFDSPRNLLNHSSSLLASLVKESGTANQLRAQANAPSWPMIPIAAGTSDAWIGRVCC